MRVFQIVFVIVSVNNIFSAESMCQVKFYKLADAVNNVFDRDSSKQVSDFSFDIKSNDLTTNRGHVIKFLEDKILEKFNNKSIGIYCLEGLKRNGMPFRTLCVGGPMKKNALDKKFDSTQENGVYTLINDAIVDDGALNVYFYPHDKQQDPNGKKNDSNKNGNGKKCCC